MSSAQDSVFCAAAGDMHKFLLYMDADMPMSEIGNRHLYYFGILFILMCQSDICF